MKNSGHLNKSYPKLNIVSKELGERTTFWSVGHNVSIKCFPQIIIANWCNLKEASIFEGDDEILE